jgi:hypothetical protein
MLMVRIQKDPAVVGELSLELYQDFVVEVEHLLATYR